MREVFGLNLASPSFFFIKIMKITKRKVNFTYRKEDNIYEFTPLNEKAERFLNNRATNKFIIWKIIYKF